MPIWGFSVDELANKQLASDSQQRRSDVHNASVAGNVGKVLQLLEESADPYVAQRLAVKAKQNFLKQNFLSAAQELEDALEDLPSIKFAPQLQDQPPQFNVHTGQISTGKVASLLLTVVKATNLPVKDGLTSSCDPFCKLKLVQQDQGGNPVGVVNRSTEVKMMTLNPEWNETFQIDIDSMDATMVAEVYDWDEDETHDYIGTASISLSGMLAHLLQEREASFKKNSELSETIRDARAVHSYNLGKTYESFWKTGAVSEQGIRRWLPARAELSKFGRAAQCASAHAVSARPEHKHMALTSLDGSTTKQLGSLHLILHLVPAPRAAVVSGIQLFPRKGLEIVNALTPSSRLVFTQDEYLENTEVKDARFGADRVLTRGVLWPKSIEGAAIDSAKVFRQSLAHASWRTMTEPVRGCPERNREEVYVQDAVTVARLARSLGGGKLESVGDIRARRVLGKAKERVAEAQREWDAGRLEGATELLEEGVKFSRDGGDSALHSEATKLLGDLYLARGQFRRAREHHRAHMDIAAQARSSPSHDHVGQRNQSTRGRRRPARELEQTILVRSREEEGGDLEEGGSGGEADDRYWLERAKTRLEKVDWTEGQGQVKMEHVRDTILELKQERAGQLAPSYVPPHLWGGAAPLP